MNRYDTLLERFSSKIATPNVCRAFGILPVSALARESIGFITDGVPYVRAHAEAAEAFGAGDMLIAGWSYLLEVGEDGRVIGLVLNDDREVSVRALEASLEDLDPERERVLWGDPEKHHQVFGPDGGERYFLLGE